MTSSMSHELTTPLRHLVGFADLLGRDAGSQLSQTGLGYLEKMSQAARRMTELVHKLLTFNSLARTPLDTTRVCLDELLREALLDFQVDLQGRDIHWVLDPLPMVWADRDQLRLVFENFISNALKFTRKRDKARIEIGCAPAPGRHTVIFVRDDGAGFEPKYGGRLFKNFQRLHSREDFEGTGLGLAHARCVIERHGGKTWAEGSLNAGATFYFSLPPDSGVRG